MPNNALSNAPMPSIGEDEALDCSIKVSVRMRPWNLKDKGRVAWQCNENESWIKMVEGEESESGFTGKEKFKFNFVLDSKNSSQEIVYDKVAARVVQKVMEGYNGKP